MKSSSNMPKAIAVLAFLVGAGAVVGSFSVPVEYTTTGGRTLEGWWLAMLGLSLMVVGLGWATSWRRAGLLTSLFIVGLTAQLTLTQPHWSMFIRVAPHQLERPEHYLSMAVLALEGLVVLALALRHVGALTRFLRSVLTPVRVALATLTFLFCAANVAAVYPQVFEWGFHTELYVRWWIAAALILGVNLGVLWQIGVALPSKGLDWLADWVSARFTLPGEDGPPKARDAWLPWILGASVLAVTLLFGKVVLAFSGLLGDEVVMRFMAEAIASGHLAVPTPPVPEAFEMYMVEVRDGFRYATWIPGWPMALAVGTFFGVPWLVNPLFGALSIPTAHALTRRLTDRGTANVVALLLAVSPWFLILSTVYQPHAMTLLAALVAWLGIHRASTDDSHLWAFAGGLAAGVAFSVRPMDGLVIGGAGFLYAILGLGGKRSSLSALAAYVVGCVATGSVSLYVNYLFTGDPRVFPMNVYFDRVWAPGANRLGFGADVGRVWGGLDPIPGHGWRDILFNLNLNLFTLNYEMLGWGIGSLFLVVVHLLWGRLTRMDWAWLAFIVGAIGLYSLYWFNGGPDYGPRYWYSTLFPFLFLSAKGLSTLIDRLKEWAPGGAHVGTRVAVLAGLLCASSVLVYGTWRSVGKYLEYRVNEPEMRELLEAGAFGEEGLVLVDAEAAGWYAALELNSLVPGEEGPVFARDLGPEVNAELMEAFPDRPIFRARMRVTSEGKTVEVTRLDGPPGRPDGVP